MKASKEKVLTEKQKRFCEKYIFAWNATKSYQEIYPDVNYDTAKTNGNRLLTYAYINDYIKEIQKDIEKQAGISRNMVLNEHMKLAFSSIAHLHNTWIQRKDFDKLTEEQKACISEISTQIRKVTIKDKETPIEVEYIKIKLYDKQKSLDSISKMLGYNEPEQLNIGLKDKIKGITFDK